MDERTQKLLSAASLVLGLVSGLLSFSTDFADKFGTNSRVIFVAAFLLLLTIAIWLNWSKISGLFDRLHRIRPLIILTALGFSVVMLSLTTYTLFSVRHLAKLSATQYVGPFPDNVPAIVQILDNATESIRIAMDHTAYGAFSNPAAHDRLVAVLAKKAQNGVSVEVLSYDDETVGRKTEEQFRLKIKTPTEASAFWDSDEMKRFLGYNRDFAPPRSQKQFVDLVKKKDNQVADLLKKKSVGVVPELKELPIFLWIVDRRIAAFSFYNTGATHIPHFRPAISRLRKRRSQHLLSSPPGP